MQNVESVIASKKAIIIDTSERGKQTKKGMQFCLNFGQRVS